MKYSEARQGRIFIIRLEDGEILHKQIEQFAREHSIRAAAMVIVGGADTESRLITGPREGRAVPVEPMSQLLENVHEIAGTGTLFSDEDGNPVVHAHIACGRERKTVTGCIRDGVVVWHIVEIILFELTGSSAVRKVDPKLGFKLLQP